MQTTQPHAAASRTRLYMKDGSYQIVLDYRVDGNVVRYHSAERNGEAEEIPLALVDLARTEQVQRSRADAAAGRPGVLSPQLAKEEADRAARTPEIVKDLRLPEDDAVLVLDTFRGTPELVPLQQQGTDLNPETAHVVLKQTIVPTSQPHRIADIQGWRADVQLHVAEPVFYVRIGRDDDDATAAGNGLVVDTHGAGRETPSAGYADSRYVIERVDVRQDLRQIASLRLQWLGSGHPQRDITELRAEVLPGGHWMKLTPLTPLDFGEYVLMEILNDREVNLSVWDFGVHADAKENVEALRPEPRRAPALNRRP